MILPNGENANWSKKMPLLSSQIDQDLSLPLSSVEKGMESGHVSAVAVRVYW